MHGAGWGVRHLHFQMVLFSMLQLDSILKVFIIILFPAECVPKLQLLLSPPPNPKRQPLVCRRGWAASLFAERPQRNC